MRDYLNIGSTPASEDCFPVGHALARAECEIYARQLQREFPEGDFRVKGFEHDFGRYYEVVAYYNEGDGDQVSAQQEAAYAAEGGSLETWDAEAKAELAVLKGFA